MALTKAGRILALSLLVASFLLLFNLGMMYSHPVSVAAIIAGSPVYVALIARLMIGARLERGFIPACTLTVAGAVLAVPLLILLKAISKRNRLMRPVSVYLQGSDRPSPSLAAMLHPPGATVTRIDTSVFPADTTPDSR